MRPSLRSRPLAVLLAGLLAMASVHAAPPELPRLWKAVRTTPGGAPTTLYLLAASDAGLAAEYDGYLNRVVLPALRGAATLSLEGVGDGDEGPPAPGCVLRTLDGTGIAALNEARQRTLTLALQADMERRAQLAPALLAKSPDPDTQARAYAMLIETSDEFTLLQFARTQLATLASASASSAHGPIAMVLLRAHPDIAVHDIDYRLGAMHAYCASGPRRTQLLLDLLNGALVTTGAGAGAAQSRDFAAILHGQAPEASSAWLHLSALDAGLLCTRNRDWVARMASQADGKAHFYVVGARHLFPVRHDDADCGGVLADLAQAGFTATLLK